MTSSNIVAFDARSTGRPTGMGNGSIVMRSELVEKASKVIPDPPALINLVSRRVKQLNMGRPALVERTGRMGMADIALKEIIEGKILLDGTEAAEAVKKARDAAVEDAR